MFVKNLKINNFSRGFTLVEILISLAILGLVSTVVATFMVNVFSLNSNLSGSMNAQLDARHVVKVMVAEMREASPSENGAYAIASAGVSSVTFYSDVNNDGLQDKVRYFLSGSDIKRGVVVPTGSPYTYDDDDEKVTTIFSGVISSSTAPLFQYYSADYSGTGSPLSQPVTASTVRLVKITVIIDRDKNRAPTPMIVTSQVNLRNLKDNL